MSLNFIDDTMFVSTVERRLLLRRLRTPQRPRLLSSIPMYIWENEDMDVDRVRKRIFISRDPRGFTGAATPGNFPYGAVHIIDVSNPAQLPRSASSPCRRATRARA